MTPLKHTIFDLAAWEPALAKYGAVTQLSVALYGADARVVLGPLPVTPILGVLREHDHDPDVFAECVGLCLAQHCDDRPPVVVTRPSGLAVVGVSLLLDGGVVGAVVAGYALTQFCESVTIARLARESGVPFQALWAVARRQPPVPGRRLMVYGELLKVLGDTLLQENDLRRQSDDVATQLAESAAVKEEFLAVLSHELRTPLTPILGWTTMLKRHADAGVVQAATVIQRNAVFQLRLVEDLLELTRATRGKLTLSLKLVCLEDLVESVVEAVAENAQARSIAVRVIDAPEPLCVNGDADRIQQILRNVLLNALKFTPADGSVTITLLREGNDAVVHIRDTGQGIAAEFLPLVFEMFKQEERGTRRTHGGLGIGLALVKQLTEAHGGCASVTSTGVGLGTLVTIRLPLAPDAGEVPERLPAHADNVMALVGRRILVVEDTEDSRIALRMTLERLGATVLAASDGIEALETLTGRDVDLILCDLRMPRMDGFQFVRELHAVKRATYPPVIAVSGLASSADHQATAAAGFKGHVGKPYDERQLLGAVAAAMSAGGAG